MCPDLSPARGSAASPRHLRPQRQQQQGGQGDGAHSAGSAATPNQARRRSRPQRAGALQPPSTPLQRRTGPLAARPPPAPAASLHSPASAARPAPGRGPGGQGTCGHSRRSSACRDRQVWSTASELVRSCAPPPPAGALLAPLTCCWAAGCEAPAPPRAGQNHPRGLSPQRRPPPSRQACRHPAPPPWGMGVGRGQPGWARVLEACGASGTARVSSRKGLDSAAGAIKPGIPARGHPHLRCPNTAQVHHARAAENRPAGGRQRGR